MNCSCQAAAQKWKNHFLHHHCGRSRRVSFRCWSKIFDSDVRCSASKRKRKFPLRIGFHFRRGNRRAFYFKIIRASSELKIPRGELSFLIEITATDESKEHCAHIRIKDLAPTTKRDSSRTTAMMMMTKMILPLPRRRRQGQVIHSFSSPWWPNQFQMQ